jgi:hypothetical protein
MDLKPTPADSGRSVAAMWMGTAVFLIGLSLPLFYASFQPPGGYQILGGRRFNAFNFQATGFQFAKAAPSSRIWALLFVLLIVLGVRTLLYFTSRRTGESLDSPAAKHLNTTVVVAKGIHAITGSIVALGWLVVFSVLFLLSHTPIVHPAIPLSGSNGILSSFENPTSPGPTFETPYFTVSLGLGMLFLIIGILLCLFSVGKVAGPACILYIITAVILLIASRVFHNTIVNGALSEIRTFLFIT